MKYFFLFLFFCCALSLSLFFIGCGKHKTADETTGVVPAEAIGTVVVEKKDRGADALVTRWCQTCNTEVSLSGAKSCPKCGDNIIKEKFCPRCKSIFSPKTGHKYCPYCHVSVRLGHR